MEQQRLLAVPFAGVSQSTIIPIHSVALSWLLLLAWPAADVRAPAAL